MKTRTIQLGVQHRMATVDRESLDEQSRSLSFSFSSETPADQPFGREILDHSPGAVDLTRLRTAGPLLLQHDPDQQIGRVIRADIENRRGVAGVRFSQSESASEIFRDVVDDIRTNVSVGYRIHSMRQIEQGDRENGDPPTYMVDRWEPVELSIVSVPADFTIGVGREDHKTNIVEVYDMSEQTEQQKPAAATVDPKREAELEQHREAERTRELESAAETARQAQRKQDAEMRKLGRQYGGDDGLQMAESLIEQDRGLAELKDGLLELKAKRAKADTGSYTFDLPHKDARRFSILRALNALANPTVRAAQEAAAFEFEVSAQAAAALNREIKGIFVPHQVLAVSKRDLNVTTPTEGPELVATDHLAGSFIDMLRNRSAVVGMGARILDDLVGNIAIPRQTGAATAFWVGEGVDVTESQLALDQVAMSPKTLGAYSNITRRLLIQSSPAIEGLVRDDFAQIMALELDRAALYGSGTGAEPRGVANQTGINSFTLAAAGAPTWAETVRLETEVAADNADIGTLGYITNAAGRGSMKSTAKDAGSGMFIWDGNEVNGYRAVASNQVVANDFWFGNWADVLIGTWSGLDFIVDPYTNAPSGTVRVTVHQDSDVAVRHPESFCLANGGS